MSKEFPLYKSHKTVRALEIASVAEREHTIEGKPNEFLREVFFADRSYPAISMPLAAFLRYTPVTGDFLVVYEDGYKSFSPRKAFVEGYTLAE